MCDHCIRRERAFQALSDEDKRAADDFAGQSNARLIASAMLNGGQPDEELWLEEGAKMDVMLGLRVPAVPDVVPPDWQ